MYFNRAKRNKTPNKLIFILGFGIIIFLLLVFYQLYYSEIFNNSSKVVRVYFNFEAMGQINSITFDLNNQPINFSMTDNKIDTFFELSLIPKETYTIDIRSNNEELYNKTIFYLGEPNLLIDLQVNKINNEMTVESEDVQLFMNLSL